MLLAGRSVLIDAPSTSGRCSCSPAAWGASQRWCKRPFCSPKAAGVAHAATFPSNGTGPLLPAFPSSIDNSQQPQQQQRRQRQRRLFGGTPTPNGANEEQQQQQQQQQQQEWQQQLSSSNGNSPPGSLLGSVEDIQEGLRDRLTREALASSSCASYASDSDDDSSPASSSRRGRAVAGGSSNGQFRRSLSPDSQQQLQQPLHPQHAFLLQQQHRVQHQQQQQEQQQQQQPRQQQQQRVERTVQWYRDQANRRLTWRIQQTNDLAALRQLTRQYEGAMNAIHINAVFCRLVKLVSSRSLRPLDMLSLAAYLPQVLALVTAAVQDYDERAISNTLHGLAAMDLHQERELISSLLVAAEAVGLSSFAPQGLANLCWALATLHVNPGPRLSQQLLAVSGAMMHKFKPVELAQLGWGVAVLRLRVAEPWVQAWKGAVAMRVGSLNPQGLSMVLWAAARMWEQQEHSAHHQQALLLQQQQQQQQGGSSSSTAAAASPADLLWLIENEIRRNVYDHSPHSISICLWAMARLGHRPNKAFLQKALQAVQPQLRTASPSDLAVLMYSLAALGFRPHQGWLTQHGEALRLKTKSLSVRQVANVLWAHGRLGVLPADALVLPQLMKRLLYGMQDANARDLANSLWALATLGHKPERSWMGIFGAQAEALVHDFAPQEVANLLWSYAKLGLKPPHMLLVALWEGVGPMGSGSSSSSMGSSSSSSSGSGFLGGAESRLSAFRPVELSMLLWSLATLRVQPGKLWWEQFLQASYHKMQAQSPQALSNVIWSLSEMQLQPPPAWLYHWAAATRGVLDQMNPIDLGQVAAALQSPTFEPLGLPKLEALLLDVLDRLAAVELQSGAYSKAAVELLMRMPQQPGSSSSSSSMAAAAVAASNGDRSLIQNEVQELKEQLLQAQRQRQQQQQQRRPAATAATAALFGVDSQDLLSQEDITAMAGAAAGDYGESAVHL